MEQALTVYTNPASLRLTVSPNREQIVVVCFHHVKGYLKAGITLNLAEGSGLRLIILANLQQSCQLELHTEQTHREPNASSDLLCKAVVQDNAKFSFNGKIVIGQKGHRSHAYQRNENLLLSSGSAVVSEPSLEILANDVFCTHGATSGYLDEEEIHYLSTRGIARSQAAKMLTKGFLLSGLDKLLVHEKLPAKQFHSLEQSVVRSLMIE